MSSPNTQNDLSDICARVGQLGCGFISGMSACFSLTAVPAIQQCGNGPAGLAVFNRLFHTGKSIVPPLAVISASGLLVSHFTGPKPQRKNWKPLAAGLVLAIIPYTLIFMKSTNDQLLNLHRTSAAGAFSDEWKDLIARWAGHNWVRAASVFAAFAITVFA